MTVDYAVVLPTVGRPSLAVTLRSLAGATPPGTPGADGGRAAPVEVVVVDDRPLDATPLTAADLGLGDDAPWPLRVLRSGGRGPAAARNVGWRSVAAEWVAFLDDDVVVPPAWGGALVADLAAAADDVGGVQGRIEVPLPDHRPPTDWERNTAGLERAAWATADMAYRRQALADVHGMDERFPRAFREDADLAIRVRAAGWRLERGARSITHPARPADDAVSVRMQAGAASDALMRALHGPAWRELGETGRGRFRWHVATVAAGLVAVGAAAARRPGLAAAAGTAWAALTADFARRRITPGPRPGHEGWAAEWRRMAWTSAVIPVEAVRHRLLGEWRARGAVAWPPPVEAVLLDRDGTIVEDVPYNGEPDKVRPVDGATGSLVALRAAGLRVGVVSNQSGVARGLLTTDQVEAVNARVVELFGPFDDWQYCPHDAGDRCACRKPAPGMVLAAARALGVAPYACAVVGDIGADVGAAVAAGARAVLVPTAQTRAEEVAAAPVVARDLRAAVSLLLDGSVDDVTRGGSGGPARAAASERQADGVPADGVAAGGASAGGGDR